MHRLVVVTSIYGDLLQNSLFFSTSPVTLNISFTGPVKH